MIKQIEYSEHAIKCRHCKALLTFEQEDIQYSCVAEWNGRKVMLEYITCVSCNNEVIL